MDPAIAGVLVKAATAAGAEGEKTASGLLTRLLGPSADAIGDALGRWTESRVGNVGHILGRADTKARAQSRSGGVPPRLAHHILEEGSFCDDEVVTEYLAGLLAGSRTPAGRDDRAVSWSGLLASMSSAQIRLHYIAYREWAHHLRGRYDINIGINTQVSQCQMYLDLHEVVDALTPSETSRELSIVPHAAYGLIRLGLLGDEAAFGQRSASFVPESPIENFVYLTPSAPGVELFGWAAGMPGLLPLAFTTQHVAFDLDPPLPRLSTVLFPRLAETSDLVDEGGSSSAP